MRTLLATLTAAILLAAAAPAADASESPWWNPRLCAGMKWTECTALPGSECQAIMRNGQILVLVDTCVEAWYPNYRRRVILRVRRHRL